jgi:HAMP domain-containing protein
VSLVLLAIGCAVSLGLSRLVSREIGRLTRAAHAFAAGEYDARVEPGPIEEVAVVGATFGIMGSVLRDTTARSAREMAQAERFNSESAIAEAFSDRFAPPVQDERGGVAVAIGRVGPPLHGHFGFACSTGDGHYACLGRVEAPRSFDAALAASSAAAVLTDGLASGARPEACLARAADLFPLRACVLVYWKDSGGRVIGWAHRAGGAPVPLEMDISRARAFTTLDEQDDRRAVRFVERYACAAPARAVEEVRQLAGPGAAGGVLVIQGAAS